MDNKFVNLQELIDALEIGLEIQCYIDSVRYYLGHSDVNGRRLIAVCPDGDSAYFDTVDEMLNHEVNGKALKNIWQEIEIIAM